MEQGAGDREYDIAFDLVEMRGRRAGIEAFDIA
jgi:hypothetical protein